MTSRLVIEEVGNRERLIVEDEVIELIVEQPVATTLLEIEVPGIQGIQGDQGIQGIQGDPGTPGADSGFFEYEQILASNVWTVNHNLGFYPAVSTVDSGDTVVEGEIEYISINQVVIRFEVPFSGRVFLS